MDVYACDGCGYYYDPKAGDEPNGIEPGTPFEELPEDWVCPDCGTGAEHFYMIPDMSEFEEDEAFCEDDDPEEALNYEKGGVGEEEVY